jgi:hypothetical protein
MGIMKTKYRIAVIWIVAFWSLAFSYHLGRASDTCMFAVTADDVPPNIVILIDNGAEMKHPVTHGDYNSSVDYTPNVDPEVDVVSNGGLGNGFFNDNGYGIYSHGGSYYLVPVGNNLTLNTAIELEETGAKGSGTWTINGQTITLPAIASSKTMPVCFATLKTI